MVFYGALCAERTWHASNWQLGRKMDRQPRQDSTARRSYVHPREENTGRRSDGADVAFREVAQRLTTNRSANVVLGQVGPSPRRQCGYIYAASLMKVYTTFLILLVSCRTKTFLLRVQEPRKNQLADSVGLRRQATRFAGSFQQ